MPLLIIGGTLVLVLGMAMVMVIAVIGNAPHSIGSLLKLGTSAFVNWFKGLF